MSEANMTPSVYLIPKTDVPVTIGRRVRSMVLEMEPDVDEGARAAPPEERDSDMIIRRVVLRIGTKVELILKD